VNYLNSSDNSLMRLVPIDIPNRSVAFFGAGLVRKRHTQVLANIRLMLNELDRDSAGQIQALVRFALRGFPGACWASGGGAGGSMPARGIRVTGNCMRARVLWQNSRQ